jgi:hypothetical protein
MIYAAAWDVTGRPEYRDLCRNYLAEAVKQSARIDGRQPTYALLQMQGSLELLDALEQDAGLKRQMREVMASVSARCAERARNAARASDALDLTALCTDWRTGEGISMKGS